MASMNKRLILSAAALTSLALGSAFAQTTPVATTQEQQFAVEAVPATRLGAVRTIVVRPGLTAEQYLAEAQALAAQAAVAYPVAFVDKPLWSDAVAYAEAAVRAAPDDARNLRYLGELLTTTQWWYAALQTWRALESRQALDAQARQWAAMAAAKIGYIRLERGLAGEAVPYLEASLAYQDDADVRALLDRAQSGM